MTSDQTISSGTARTFSVTGVYLMISTTSLRNTTVPGVAPMFSPSRNERASTCRGVRRPSRTSPSRLRAPRARLAPPVSKARFSAAGLPGRVLVGASALVTMPAANRARSAVRQSTSASATAPVIACSVAR